MSRFKSDCKTLAKRNIARAAVVASSLLALAAASQPAADAYYYPFYYRGLSNLLYPLRYAAYPFVGGYGPYSAWTTASPYRMLTTGRLTGYPYMYGPQMLKNYQDPEPLGYGRQRVKQKRAGQEFGVDEVNNAQWADGEQDERLNSAPPQAVQGGFVQGATPGQLTPQQISYLNGAPMLANAAQGAGSFSVPQPAADGTPPVAPPIVSKNPIALAPNMRDVAPTGIPGKAHAPLADGFINLVNTKFNGNIQTALFDPETRGWAKCLGLVSDDSLFGMDFPDTRIELIKSIFADPSLDSVSKLGAIKILLNSGTGANRAKH